MRSKYLEKNLFNKLETKYQMYKIAENKKEASRKEFADKIKNAKKNIYLFGLNFPNYDGFDIGFKNNPIRQALKELDEKQKNGYIDVYIYYPSLEVMKKIKQLFIYTKKEQLKEDKNKFRSLEKDHKHFKTLKFHYIEYDRLYMFGASMIDVGTDEAFLHISQIKKNKYIKDAPYFNMENNHPKEVLALIANVLDNIKDKYTSKKR